MIYNLSITGNQSSLGKAVTALPMESILKCEIHKRAMYLMIECTELEVKSLSILLESYGCSVSLIKGIVTEVKDFALFRKNIWGLYQLHCMLETGIKADSKEYQRIKGYYKYCPMGFDDKVMERSRYISDKVLIPIPECVSSMRYVALKSCEGFMEKVTPLCNSLEECKEYVKRYHLDVDKDIHYSTISCIMTTENWTSFRD